MKKTVPLKKNYEFQRVYSRGKYYVGRFMVLYVLKNSYNINRLGITASKKVGKSVKRNRLRRLIKENYRAKENLLIKGYDMVFVGRNTNVLPSFVEIKKEMTFLFKKLDMIDWESSHCSPNL